MTRTAKRIPFRPAIALYLGIGIFLMGVRSLCLFTWAIWHLFAPISDGYGSGVSYLGTCVVALKGTLLMPVLWPVGVYWWLKGPATLGSIFLYPWLALPR